MKQILRKWFVLGVFLALVFQIKFSAEAAESKIVTLKAGKTYSYDLNGDKKEEKILIKVEQRSQGPVADIYINSKKLASRSWKNGGDNTELQIQLIDLETSDKYKEIHIVQQHITQGEWFDYAYIYRYNGKTMSLYGSISSPGHEWTSLKTVQPGDGRIVYRTTIQYVMPDGQYFDMAYKKSGGEMKEVSSSFSVISINKTAVSIYKASTVQLKAMLNGTVKKAKWTSSKKSVATVNSKGKVTAKKAGTATITAKIDGKSVTCKVKVINPTIKLNKKTVTLGAGSTQQLTATVKGNSKKVSWKSSNTKTATVNSKGKVTAKKSGTVTITAKANGVSAKCKIKIISLKAPSISNWKNTYDSATDPFVFDGVTYTVTWKKVSGAKGYQIYYYEEDADGAVWEKKKFTTKASFSTSFSHDYRKIKAKVRAYTVLNGIKIYSPWSALKTKTLTFGITEPTLSSVTGTFKSLRGKAFTYKNSEFSYGVAFGKANNNVFIGVWNPSGTSASYEDFLFTVKEGQYEYSAKGMRSGKTYHISLYPKKNSIGVNIYNSGYSYFNVYKTFSYTANAGFQDYADY